MSLFQFFGSPNIDKLKAKKDIPSLIKALTYKANSTKANDVHIRCLAAGALGEIKDSRAVESLIAALKDSSSDVRFAATRALGEIRDERAESPLIAALKDDDWRVRAFAALVLGKIKTRAVETILATLKDKNPKVRGMAALVLGEHLKDIRGIQPLIALLDVESDKQEAYDDIVSALFQYGTLAVEPLINALKGKPSYQTQTNYVALILGEIKDARAVEPLIALLELDGTMTQKYARNALISIGAPALEPLVAMLKDDNTRIYQAHMGLEVLATIGVPAVEPLIAIVMDDNIDQDLRDSIIHTLKDKLGWQPPDIRKLEENRDVEGLIQALTFVDWLEAHKAAEALSKIGDVRAVEPLIAKLNSKRDDLYRVGIAEVLGLFGDPRAVAPLIASLNKYDLQTPRAAANSLKQLLESVAQDIDAKDLRAITKLPDGYFRESRQTGGDDSYTDCEPIKQLALDELIRRGSVDEKVETKGNISAKSKKAG